MKKLRNKPNYLNWVGNAKQGLSLLRTKKQRAWMVGMNREDIDKWAHDEYVRHFGEPCGP